MAKASEKSPELLEVEARHGFVFGLPDDYESTKQPQIASVNCSNPTCERRGQFHAVHADTVLPLLCGGCGTVLMCDHNFDNKDAHPIQTVSAGTFGSPREESYQRCDKCGTESKRTVKQLEPLRIEDLPFATVQKMIAGADDEPGSVRL